MTATLTDEQRAALQAIASGAGVSINVLRTPNADDVMVSANPHPVVSAALAVIDAQAAEIADLNHTIADIGRSAADFLKATKELQETRKRLAAYMESPEVKQGMAEAEARLMGTSITEAALPVRPTSGEEVVRLTRERAEAATAHIADLAAKDAEIAALRQLCAEVDLAVGNGGIHETAVLTRARLRGAAGLALPPTPERVAEYAAMIRLDLKRTEPK